MSLLHRVSRPLSDFVDFLWISDGYTQPHAAERIMPTGCMGLVLNLAERAHSGVVSGARTAAMVLDTSRPLSLIGVSFKAGGGFPFFGLPAGELQDQSVSLSALWENTGSLQERLIDAQSHAARFQILERALVTRLGVSAVRNPVVTYAVAAFENSEGPSSVAAVVDRTGLSARRFIATFRDHVGLTPKVFCRVSRFRRVIAGLGPSPGIDWTSVALRSGYFDQAHFNHDFRAFAGISPSEYVRDRTGNANHVRIR